MPQYADIKQQKIIITRPAQPDSFMDLGNDKTPVPDISPTIKIAAVYIVKPLAWETTD